MTALVFAAASTDTASTDFLWAGIALVVTIVICAVLLVVRSWIRNQGLRDFLGITAAFFVLTFVAFAMIVGEKLLG